eukprot:CAMPEP_0197544226 /NCGR_PEP_ID=MMETSP1318-20131121/68654_1 /TAXON_ID=552666 /ORGANISM="Partenskyella glossopodia, Strain RCC365" /LENGTH=92 /DNA_ID=CAMNT_0043103607 /DNA_START=492 /DNA_END=770 /DNA_ORIENTATION=+
MCMIRPPLSRSKRPPSAAPVPAIPVSTISIPIPLTATISLITEASSSSTAFVEPASSSSCCCSTTTSSSPARTSYVSETAAVSELASAGVPE